MENKFPIKNPNQNSKTSKINFDCNSNGGIGKTNKVIKKVSDPIYKSSALSGTVVKYMSLDRGVICLKSECSPHHRCKPINTYIKCFKLHLNLLIYLGFSKSGETISPSQIKTCRLDELKYKLFL